MACIDGHIGGFIAIQAEYRCNTRIVCIKSIIWKTKIFEKLRKERCNQKPYIEDRKRKIEQHEHYNNIDELRYSRNVNSSCFTGGTLRITVKRRKKGANLCGCFSILLMAAEDLNIICYMNNVMIELVIYFTSYMRIVGNIWTSFFIYLYRTSMQTKFKILHIHFFSSGKCTKDNQPVCVNKSKYQK
jgi:hypothetical protein